MDIQRGEKGSLQTLHYKTKAI